MNMIKAQIEEMYEYLEIYDAYNKGRQFLTFLLSLTVAVMLIYVFTKGGD